MALRKFLIVAVGLMAVLLFNGCFRREVSRNLKIETIQFPYETYVSADTGSVEIPVTIRGKDYQKVETEDLKVYLTYGNFSGIEKTSPGNFSVKISGLTDVKRSPVDMEVRCCGVRSYGKIIILPGAPATIDLQLSGSRVSSDVGEVEGSFTILDNNGNTLFFDGVTVETSAGNVEAVWREGDKYKFKVNGLTDVRKSPVVISVIAGKLRATKQVEILVGKLAQFCIDPVQSPQIVNYPFTIHIKACDQHGNVYTAFNDRVNIEAEVGEIEPGVSGRFDNGERYEDVMIHQEAAGEIIRVSYGGIFGRSNPFDVHPQPASKLTIDADKTLISADDPGVELTITLENDQGYRIAGKHVVVELYDKDGRKLDDSDSDYGIVSHVFDNGDGTYTCFVSELRDVNGSPYTVRAKMASLSDEIQISVVPGEMDHFEIDEIPSQRAGAPFMINFTASDSWGNRVYIYSGKVTISAECRSGDQYQPCAVMVNDASSNPYFPGNNVVYGQSIPITVSFPQDHRDGARIVITDGTYMGTSNEFKVFPSLVGPGTIPNTPYVISGFRFFVVFDTADIPPDGSCDFNSTPDRIIAGEPFHFYVVARYYGVNPNNPQDTACYQTGIYDRANPFDGNVWISDATGSLKLLGSSYKYLSPDFPVTPDGSIINPIYEKYIEVTAVVEKTASNDTIQINPSLRSGMGSGASSGFEVLPGNVDHIVIDQIPSPQVAGSEFTLSAAAVDKEGNVVPLDLNVEIRDKSGTITPTSAEFRDGRLSVQVMITQVFDDDTITIDGGDAHSIAESNVFDVISPLAVDHFEVRILSDTSSIKVGVPVTYEVIARNPAGNVVSSFNYSVSLTDLTGTVSPNTTKKFENGVLRDTFVVMKTTDNDRIFITGGGARGESVAFNVGAGALDHFEIDHIDSPQFVNKPFYITVRAIDIGGNLKTDYSGYHPLRIADYLGKISPETVTVNFSGGVLYQQVKIGEEYRSDVIFVGDNNGHSGASNAFDVTFGALDHFVCETPQDQVAGYPFHFYCTAYDEYGNVKGDYNKKVTAAGEGNGYQVEVTDEEGCIIVLEGSFHNGKMDALIRPLPSCPNTDRLILRDNSISTTTDWFNIRHDRIYFTTSHIDDQVKGVSFSLNIRVTDSSGYLYNYFHGALEIKDLTGTIRPTVTGNFTGSSYDQEVVINRTAQSDRIILTNFEKKVTESNSFAVHGPPLGRIKIFHIDERQLVDYPFRVSMAAYDIYGNLKDDYNETVPVEDVTGTLEPSTITFVNGYAVTDVVIHAIRPDGDDRIKVTYNTLYGTQVTYSNYFSVEERKLDHFIIDAIPDQSEYISFYITVKAVDLKNNVYEDFNGKVKMEDLSGTLDPTESDYFVNGVLSSQKVRIDQLYNSDQIHVYYYSEGITYEGFSNYFNVGPTPVRAFYFDQISDQVQDVPFVIHIKAVDANGKVVNGFEAKVNLSAIVGLQNAISPTQTGNFINGEIYQTVVITAPSPSIFGQYIPITINASLPGVGMSSSNPFIVYPR